MKTPKLSKTWQLDSRNVTHRAAKVARTINSTSTAESAWHEDDARPRTFSPFPGAQSLGLANDAAPGTIELVLLLASAVVGMSTLVVMSLLAGS
jgi:hypothetical protein